MTIDWKLVISSVSALIALVSAGVALKTWYDESSIEAREFQNKVEQNTRDIAELKERPTAPLGVVVASTVECPALGAGWSRFDEGAGRFIIGAGFGTDKNGERQGFEAGNKDGEYRHKLSVAELPKYDIQGATNSTGRHHHEFGLGYAKVDGEYPSKRVRAGHSEEGGRYSETYLSNDAGEHTHQVTVNSGGGNGSHPIMPPYIALHWCKKER